MPLQLHQHPIAHDSFKVHGIGRCSWCVDETGKAEVVCRFIVIEQGRNSMIHSRNLMKWLIQKSEAVV